MEPRTKFLSLVSEEGEMHDQKVPEDGRLELRLGPPGEIHDQYQKVTTAHGAKGVLQDTIEAKKGDGNWSIDIDKKQCMKFPHNYETAAPKLFSSSLAGSFQSSAFQKESLKELKQMKRPYFQCSKAVDLQFSDKNACSSPGSASVSATASTTNSSAKRVAVVPVVGWPPIRSSRKNLASVSASKVASELPTKNSKEGNVIEPESPVNDLFVKVNMEGVPIGRKINLKAYDSYEKLSIAIDELFRGLLEAQMEIFTAGNENNTGEAKADARPVAGNREYTLVYEDNEGDRILVGDVPWNMFVSTAKRLHVLKSSKHGAAETYDQA